MMYELKPVNHHVRISHPCIHPVLSYPCIQKRGNVSHVKDELADTFTFLGLSLSCWSYWPMPL